MVPSQSSKLIHIVPQSQGFACQALDIGIGIGLVFVRTATTVTQQFKPKRGLAIDIVMNSGSFGGTPFPASTFLPTFRSWNLIIDSSLQSYEIFPSMI